MLICGSLGAQPNPRAEGPYPVGVTTTVFVDASRTDNLTKKPRTMVTEIWYPATDDARSLPKNRYRDFFSSGIGSDLAEVLERTYRMPWQKLEERYLNHAVRDARVRPGVYPLVLFSHGNGGTRTQNTFWADHLASHGYIVVSPDHTGNARYTVIDGELIRGQGSERQRSAADRPKDMSFLLDEMIRWNKGADSRFAGRIDTEKVAVTGMSFGAFTAVLAADADPRFRAVIAMAAAPEKHSSAAPSLYMLGALDGTIRELGNGLIRANYQAHAGPAALLELTRGGHYSFTDMYKINPAFGDGVGDKFTPREVAYDAINAVSAAFLGLYLKGQQEYSKFLEANHWPVEVTWSRK
jgi:dienelactone hydrolase